MPLWKIEKCDGWVEEDMKKLADFTFGIVGLGLMGGSLAKAIRGYVLDEHNATGKILGSDINAGSVSLAVEQHIVDKGYTSEQLHSITN